MYEKQIDNLLISHNHRKRSMKNFEGGIHAKKVYCQIRKYSKEHKVLESVKFLVKYRSLIQLYKPFFKLISNHDNLIDF